MSRCFILGCSQAAGLNMVGDQDLSCSDRRFYNAQTYGYHHSYPALLAKKMGYTDIRNYAIVSGSTDAMARIFHEIIDEIDPVNDIVMACWTGGDRSEYWDDESKTWIPLMILPEICYPVFQPSAIALAGLPEKLENSPRHEEIYQQWVLSSSIKQAHDRLVKNITGLNNLAQENKIKVCNIFSFVSPVLAANDQLTRWWWPIGTQESFETFAESRDYKSIDGCGHYAKHVHEAFANLILTAIHGSQ